MRIKIELEADETIEQAEEELKKALNAKETINEEERFADDWLNEFEVHVKDEHQKLLDKLLEQIQDKINANIQRSI